MKKLLCLLMAMLMLMPMLIACQPTDVPGESSDSSSETDPPKEPAVILDLITGGETSYTIVRSSAASSLTGASFVCLMERLTRFASRSTPISLT